MILLYSTRCVRAILKCKVHAFYHCRTPIPSSHLGMEGKRSFVCEIEMGPAQPNRALIRYSPIVGKRSKKTPRSLSTLEPQNLSHSFITGGNNVQEKYGSDLLLPGFLTQLRLAIKEKGNPFMLSCSEQLSLSIPRP